MTPYTLEGSYDITLTDYCNLNCKGCCALDWLEEGKIVVDKNNLDSVKSMVSNLQRLDLRLQELKLTGGEPTLCNDLGEIIEYLKSIDIADCLTIVTNGLNFTDKVVRSIMKLDRIMISVYPVPTSFDKDKKSADSHRKKPTFMLSDIIKKSDLGKSIGSKVELDFWHQWTFEQHGQPQDGVEYSQELNWERCYQKDDCRQITNDGGYICTQTYNKRIEMCSWDDRQKVIDFFERDKPMNNCKVCPFPPKRMEWDTNDLPIDTRNYLRGIELIQNCQQKTLDFVKNY